MITVYITVTLLGLMTLSYVVGREVERRKADEIISLFLDAKQDLASNVAETVSAARTAMATGLWRTADVMLRGVQEHAERERDEY